MKTSKTNLEKAAKFNYYQFENLPEEAKKDNWFSQRYLNADLWNREIPEFLTNSNFEIGVFAEVRKQYKNFSDEIELYFIEGFHILLFSDSLDFPVILQKDFKTQKYYFYPIWSLMNKLQANTNYRQRENYLNVISEPQKIGVFSDKKVTAWVDYCKQYVSAHEKCNADILSKKNENQSYIDSVVTSFPDAKVEKWENHTTIKTKLFYIEFSLLNGGDYLDKKISFTGSIDDIISFQL